MDLWMPFGPGLESRGKVFAIAESHPIPEALMQPARPHWLRLLRSLTSAAPALTACIIMISAALAAPRPAVAQTFTDAPLTQIPIDGEDISAHQTVPSPDGRWLAGVRVEGTNSWSLWIAPAAGGERVRLTSGGYLDQRPDWSPSGDRLFFRSNRPARGEPGSFIMTLRIDPQTGRALDEPRQVTLERESSNPAVSPDGRSVLYRTGLELRVVPAMGGTSRVVATLPEAAPHFAWAPAGDAIYYVAWDTERVAQSLYHQSLSGGPPTDVLRLAEGRFARVLAPAAGRLATLGPMPGQRDLTIEILDFSGRVIARHNSDSNARPIAFSADGATLLFAASDAGAIMRVRPIAGGDPIDLTDGESYDWPEAWSADSRAVIVSGVVDGVSALRVLPLDGGEPRVVTVPADEPHAQFSSTSATHATYRVQVGDDRTYHRIFALDLATGERALLTEGSVTRLRVGPDGFHFREEVDNQIHWRSAAQGRQTRTFYTAPADFAAGRTYDFHGDHVAYYELVGDSVAVMLKDSPDAAPRILTTLGVPARRDRCCVGDLSFSPDAQWIVAYPRGSNDIAVVTFIRVPEAGRATDVRNVSLDAEYWYDAQWAPDSRGVSVIAGLGNGAWVAFVPTAPGERVRHLSRADDLPTWGFAMSPDGRYVAYPAEVFRGGSLWKMEIR
jgi:Tol biopolymer transport system component